MEYAPIISTEDIAETGGHISYHSGQQGQGFDMHSHPWSHKVTCTAGSLKVTYGGVVSTLNAGDAAFEFENNIEHEIEVLEDGTEFFTEHPDVREFVEAELKALNPHAT